MRDMKLIKDRMSTFPEQFRRQTSLESFFKAHVDAIQTVEPSIYYLPSTFY